MAATDEDLLPPRSWIFAPSEVDAASAADGIAPAQARRLRRAACCHIADTVRAVIEDPARMAAAAAAARAEPSPYEGYPTERDLEVKVRAPAATAMVLFNRFFARHSFARHDRWRIATACVFMGFKVEESHQKVRHVINASWDVFHRGARPRPEANSLAFGELRTAVLEAERAMLHTLEFDVAVEQPFAHIKQRATEWRDGAFRGLGLHKSGAGPAAASGPGGTGPGGSGPAGGGGGALSAAAPSSGSSSTPVGAASALAFVLSPTTPAGASAKAPFDLSYPTYLAHSLAFSALGTDLCLRYSATTLAAACLLMAFQLSYAGASPVAGAAGAGTGAGAGSCACPLTAPLLRRMLGPGGDLPQLQEVCDRFCAYLAEDALADADVRRHELALLAAASNEAAGAAAPVSHAPSSPVLPQDEAVIQEGDALAHSAVTAFSAGRSHGVSGGAAAMNAAVAAAAAFALSGEVFAFPGEDAADETAAAIGGDVGDDIGDGEGRAAALDEEEEEEEGMRAAPLDDDVGNVDEIAMPVLAAFGGP